MAVSPTVQGTLRWRLHSVWWYLKRPALYAHAVRMASSRMLQREQESDTRPEAEAWCAACAVDTEEALRQLTGRAQLTPLRTLHAEAFATAETAAATCPVAMGGAAGLDLLYWLAEAIEARRVIETGVAYGWSSLALLLSLCQRDGSRLISTDMPYTNRDNDSYVGCVVPESLRANWQIIRCADRDGLPTALKRLPSIDLCHYDSDKSYTGRRWAYPRLWKALRPGGVFLSDDVGDNLALHDFCQEIGVEPLIVGIDGKYIAVIRRPS